MPVSGAFLDWLGEPRCHVHELKVGARVLLKTPVFSGSAILTIALATGLAMLTFAVVYGAVLRPPPSLVANGSLLSGPTPSSRHWVCATS